MVHTKVPVVNRQDYVMYLEMYEGLLWFHTDIFKWTAQIKAKYLEDLNLLQHLVAVPLVALVDEDNKKLAKFGEVTGWELFETMKLNNGKVGYVYKRSL